MGLVDCAAFAYARFFMDAQSPQPLPLAGGGLDRFVALADQLPVLLERLRTMAPLSAPFETRGGVYVFSENGQPMYVGQTRTFRRRMGQHTGAYSEENQAVFAFNIAKADAHRAGLDITRARKALVADPVFADLFRLAKVRVAAMEVRFVEIVDDPELRTVFEVYAAVAFGTQQFNSFDTH